MCSPTIAVSVWCLLWLCLSRFWKLPHWSGLDLAYEMKVFLLSLLYMIIIFVEFLLFNLFLGYFHSTPHWWWTITSERRSLWFLREHFLYFLLRFSYLFSQYYSFYLVVALALAIMFVKHHSVCWIGSFLRIGGFMTFVAVNILTPFVGFFLLSIFPYGPFQLHRIDKDQLVRKVSCDCLGSIVSMVSYLVLLFRWFHIWFSF